MRQFANRKLFYATAIMGVLLGATAQVRAADIAAGEKVAKRCQICHSFVAGEDKPLGPNLVGIIDRVAGTAEGYKYKPDFIEAGEKGLIWDEKTLSEYLGMSNTERKKFIGSWIGRDKARIKMSFVGLKKQKDREDIIEYMKSLQE